MEMIHYSYAYEKPMARHRLPIKTNIQQIGHSKKNQSLHEPADGAATGDVLGIADGTAEGADDGTGMGKELRPGGSMITTRKVIPIVRKYKQAESVRSLSIAVAR